MSQTVPAYVINLDGRPDRWRTISRHLNDLGIEAERIAAFDARDLLDKDRCFALIGELIFCRRDFGHRQGRPVMPGRRFGLPA